MILDDNEVALATDAFDQPPSPLRHFVVIAATARSGSHMLSRMLRQLGYGVPVEYYHNLYHKDFARRWGVANDSKYWSVYLDALIRHRTVNGFCVVKCLPDHFGALSKGFDSGKTPSQLMYIHLWRRDTLAQAISLRLAQQSGVWNFTVEPTTPPQPGLDVSDLYALSRVRRRLFLDEVAWRVHLRRCSCPVAHVAYEDLVDDRARELRRLVAFLDPDRSLKAPFDLGEPNSGQGLRARQYVSQAQRHALRSAYEEKFGLATPLPEP